jgi:GTP-binding protein HflX
MWTHLEKQRGGIGMRGPGEKEIETDRRIIRDRISLLEKRLREIDKQKKTQRGHREQFVRVALVGYTNVGKSTIMNLLSNSDVLVENKLFATLDTTVRKVVIGNLPFLLSDTVGFIRKLPTQLVESFKSTLDEVAEADLLLHVVDLSHPDHQSQIDAVNKTLADIGAADKPVIMVYNKIDRVNEENRTNNDETDDETDIPSAIQSPSHSATQPPSNSATPHIFISAARRTNIDALRDLLYEHIARIHAIRYPYNNFLY